MLINLYLLFLTGQCPAPQNLRVYPGKRELRVHWSCPKGVDNDTCQNCISYKVLLKDERGKCLIKVQFPVWCQSSCRGTSLSMYRGVMGHHSRVLGLNPNLTLTL